MRQQKPDPARGDIIRQSKRRHQESDEWRIEIFRVAKWTPAVQNGSSGLLIVNEIAWIRQPADVPQNILFDIPETTECDYNRRGNVRTVPSQNPHSPPSKLEINERNSRVDGAKDLQEEQHERKRGGVSPGRRRHQPFEPVQLLLGHCEHPRNNNEPGMPRLKHRMPAGA